MKEYLKKHVGEKAIFTSAEESKKFTIAGKTPSVVIIPEKIDQLKSVMALAQKERKKLLILGNNSQQKFGAVIEQPDWVISLSRLNKIISHDVADLTVTVEPGITLPRLQQHLKSSNQFLPLDPIGGDRRSVGGIAATNSSGPFRLLYGTCRDLTLGMKVVLPDGAIIKAGGKTVKNVAGYDLTRLFIGSMGTLGTIAEITFKLSSLPEKSLTILLGFDSLDQISKFAQIICTSKLVVSRCEYLNNLFIQKYLENNLISESQHYALLNIQGHQANIDKAFEQVKKIATENKTKDYVTFSNNDETDLWNRLTRSFNQGENTCCFQISVPQSQLWQMLQQTEKYSTENNLLIFIQAHAGSGILNLYLDESNQTETSKLKSHIEYLRQEAKNLQGNLIAQNIPINLRAPDIVWGKPGKNFNLMKIIKSNYDPEQLLAAGRFIGGL